VESHPSASLRAGSFAKNAKDEVPSVGGGGEVRENSCQGGDTIQNGVIVVKGKGK